MLFDELYDEYYKRIYKSRRKFKEMKAGEKVILIFMIAIGILYLIYMGFNAFKNSLIVSILTLIALCILMFIYSILYDNINEEKINNYKRENLEKLKILLKRHENYYYSLKQIDTIIEICDQKKQQENSITTAVKPLGQFVTIILIPLSFIILEKTSGEELNHTFFYALIVWFVFFFVAFIVWWQIGSYITEKLNKKQRIIGYLADDLRNLKMNEPKIPESI